MVLYGLRIGINVKIKSYALTMVNIMMKRTTNVGTVLPIASNVQILQPVQFVHPITFYSMANVLNYAHLITKFG